MKKKSKINLLNKIFLISLSIIFFLGIGMSKVVTAEESNGDTVLTGSGVNTPLSSGHYTINDNVTYSEGITIPSGNTVYINIPEGKTLTCTGTNAYFKRFSGLIFERENYYHKNPSTAGITVEPGANLYLTGNGNLIVKGGNGISAEDGFNKYAISEGLAHLFCQPVLAIDNDSYNMGGIGAFAPSPAIGGNGGEGGCSTAATQAFETEVIASPTINQPGYSGYDGDPGKSGEGMGNVYIFDSLKVSATSGTNYPNPGKGGSNFEPVIKTDELEAAVFFDYTVYIRWSENGAGGGGGGSTPAAIIGGGGAGGGGGASGSSGGYSYKQDENPLEFSGYTDAQAGYGTHGGNGGTTSQPKMSGYEKIVGGQGAEGGTSGSGGRLYITATASVNGITGDKLKQTDLGAATTESAGQGAKVQLLTPVQVDVKVDNVLSSNHEVTLRYDDRSTVTLELTLLGTYIGYVPKENINYRIYVDNVDTGYTISANTESTQNINLYTCKINVKLDDALEAGHTVSLFKDGEKVKEVQEDSTGVFTCVLVSKNPSVSSDINTYDIYVDGKDSKKILTVENNAEVTCNFYTALVTTTLDGNSWGGSPIPVLIGDGKNIKMEKTANTGVYKTVLADVDTTTYNIFLDPFTSEKTIKITDKKEDREKVVPYFTSTVNLSVDGGEYDEANINYKNNNLTHSTNVGVLGKYTKELPVVMDGDNEAPYTVEVVGSIDSSTHQVSSTSKEINISYVSVKFYTTGDATDQSKYNNVLYRSYMLKSGEKISPAVGPYLDGMAFDVWNESKFVKGEKQQKSFNFETKITSQKIFYAHFVSPRIEINGYVKTNEDGTVNPSGVWYKMPNLAIIGYSQGKNIKSMKITTTNDATIKLPARSDLTVSIDGVTKTPSGGYYTFNNDNTILLVFNDLLTITDSEKYLQSIVVKPKQSVENSLFITVSSEIISGEKPPVITQEPSVKAATVLDGVNTGSTTLTSGYYYVKSNCKYTGSATQSGLVIAPGNDVTIVIPSGVTLTAKGGNASGKTAAGAGIEVPSSSTLHIYGDGTVKAIGGNAANGSNGDNALAYSDDKYSQNTNEKTERYSETAILTYTLKSYDGLLDMASGAGGDGGGGAGAGIGSKGGDGGAGGSAISETSKLYRIGHYKYTGLQKSEGDCFATNPELEDHWGPEFNKASAKTTDNSKGSNGNNSGKYGKIYISKNIITTNCAGGLAGNSGGTAGNSTGFQRLKEGVGQWYNAGFVVSNSGGGGGGGSGLAGSKIGAGGGGGGGGGGGALAGFEYNNTSHTGDGGFGGYGAANGASGSTGGEAVGGTGGTAGGIGGGDIAPAIIDGKTNAAEYTVTFSGSSAAATKFYHYVDNQQVIVPEYSVSPKQVFRGWKVSKYARTVNSSTGPLTTAETITHMPSSKIVLNKNTFGNIVLQPVVESIPAKSAYDTLVIPNNVFVPSPPKITYYTYTVNTKLDGALANLGSIMLVDTSDPNSTYELNCSEVGVYSLTLANINKTYKVIFNGEDTGLTVNSTTPATVEMQTLTVKIENDGEGSTDLGSVSLRNGDTVVNLEQSYDSEGKPTGKFSTIVLKSKVKDNYDIYVDGTDTGFDVEPGKETKIEYFTIAVDVKNDNTLADMGNVTLRDTTTGAIKYTLNSNSTGKYSITKMKDDTNTYKIFVGDDDTGFTASFTDEGHKPEETDNFEYNYYTIKVNTKKDNVATNMGTVKLVDSDSNEITLPNSATGVYSLTRPQSDTLYKVYIGGEDVVRTVKFSTTETDRNITVDYVTLSLSTILDGTASNVGGVILRKTGSPDIVMNYQSDKYEAVTPRTGDYKIYVDEIDINESLTVGTAKTVNFYTLKYNLDGGTGYVPEDKIYKDGSSANLPDVIPTKVDNQFIGWDNGTTVYKPKTDGTFDPITISSTNHNLTAKWALNSEQEVRFSLDEENWTYCDLSYALDYAANLASDNKQVHIILQKDCTIAQNTTANVTLDIPEGMTLKGDFTNNAIINNLGTLDGKVTNNRIITGKESNDFTKPVVKEVDNSKDCVIQDVHINKVTSNLGILNNVDIDEGTDIAGNLQGSIYAKNNVTFANTIVASYTSESETKMAEVSLQGGGTVDAPSDLNKADTFAGLMGTFGEGVNIRYVLKAKVLLRNKITINVDSIYANFFDFIAPENLVCDGTPKVAKFGTDRTPGLGTITSIKYRRQNLDGSWSDWTEEAPIMWGNYQVKIDITDGDYYYGKNDLTDELWAFTITPNPTPVPKPVPGTDDMRYIKSIGFVKSFMKGSIKKTTTATAHIDNAYTTDEVSVTEKDEELPAGSYVISEGSLKITFQPDYLRSLSAGLHKINIKITQAGQDFNFKVYLIIFTPPGPSPEDKSCEKVIGPTWHWNNEKGICEEIGVVGTSTR